MAQNKKHIFKIRPDGKNDTGRPEKYTPEFLRVLAKEFLEWSLVEENFWLKDFFLDRSLNPDYVQLFSKKSEEFFGAYIIVKGRCESKLVKKALQRKHDGYFSFQCLKQMNEWKDKTEADVNVKTYEHFSREKKEFA